MSFADQVRKKAEQFKEFFTNEMFDEFGAHTEIEKRRVRDAIKDLAREGTIVRISRGFYQYQRDGRKGRPNPLTQKMKKAMVILRKFTKEDIAVTSGATPDYVNKYVNTLRKNGEIKKIGTKKSCKAKKAVYQIIENPNTKTPS